MSAIRSHRQISRCTRRRHAGLVEEEGRRFCRRPQCVRPVLGRQGDCHFVLLQDWCSAIQRRSRVSGRGRFTVVGPVQALDSQSDPAAGYGDPGIRRLEHNCGPSPRRGSRGCSIAACRDPTDRPEHRGRPFELGRRLRPFFEDFFEGGLSGFCFCRQRREPAGAHDEGCSSQGGISQSASQVSHIQSLLPLVLFGLRNFEADIRRILLFELVSAERRHV